MEQVYFKMHFRRSRFTKALLVLFLLSNPSSICGQDQMMPPDVAAPTGWEESGIIYYDGNLPEQTQDVQPNKIQGIRLDFESVSDVDLCINPFKNEPGSHTCESVWGDLCGMYSGNTPELDCSCDELCYYYNDCCPDYEIICVGGWQPGTSSMDDAASVSSAAGTATRMTLNTTLTEMITDIDYYTQEFSTSSVTERPISPTVTETTSRSATQHNKFYYQMDFLRKHIPYVIEIRETNDNLTETCFTSNLTGSDFSFYAVSSCPENASSNVTELCLNRTSDDMDSLIPVYLRLNGLFYANKFCAICNGQKNQSQIEPLTLSCKWTCKQNNSPYLKDAPSTLKECQDDICYSLTWRFSPDPRRCKTGVISTCPSNDEALVKACQSYSAYLYGFDGTDRNSYKNVHCAQCHGINETVNRCRGIGRSHTDKGDGFAGEQIPLTVLFDFTGGTLQKTDAWGENPLDCPEYQAYDRVSGSCVRVSCPPGGILIQMDSFRRECAFDIKNRTLSATLNPSYRKVVIQMASENYVNITDSQFVDTMESIRYYFTTIDYYSIERFDRDDNKRRQVELDWDGDKWMKSKNIADEEDCLENSTYGLTVTVEGTVASEIEAGINRVESAVNGKSSCDPNFGHGLSLTRVIFSNFADVGVLCNNSLQVPKAYGNQSFSRSLKNDTNIYQILLHLPSNKTETFNSSVVAQEVTFTGGTLNIDATVSSSALWTKRDRVYFCEVMPNCVLETLREDQYQWHFDEYEKASLVLKEDGRMVSNEDVAFGHTTGQVQICQFFDDRQVLEGYSIGQGLATTVGCIISLTLLSLVIVTYCTFTSLRNVPGKTVLNLSLSLFLAQLLFLVGTSQTSVNIVCLIIACVLQFTWLSVFSWTNILAFDLAQTFGKKSCIRSDKDSSTLFVKYSFYAWGTPLVIVGATVALHFLVEVDRKTENIYDLTNSCWLRGGVSLLMIFGIPVAFALMINIILFSRTILGIRSTMKAAKILKKEQDVDNNLEFLKKELNLYIRLSISVGLTWISGFIIPYTGVPALEYLFIIFNSLQGPVIFISFICSRRVMKLWSDRFGDSFSIGSSFMDRSSRNSTGGGTTIQTRAGHSGVYANNNV